MMKASYLDDPMRWIFPVLAASAIAVSANKAPSQTWLFKHCELIPISPWDFRYDACEETTDYKSLNQGLALKLPESPEFAKYRIYRGWENGMQAGFIGVTAFMAVDMLTTKALGGICSSSFNPSCEDIGLTTVPIAFYLGFFTINIPLNVFFSYKRIGYLRILVSDFSRFPETPH